VGGPRAHRGDGGETALGSGQRVRKDDARIECLGSVDELSSFLGLAAAMLAGQGAAAESLVATLRSIQRELYRLGAELGSHDGGTPGIGPAQVAALDREIETRDAALPALRAFILPGGGPAASCLHVARAICRRAERKVVRLAAAEPLGPQVIPYLNRLSLALFSLARQAAHITGHADETV
jgi:cob(I)alamin adenosyltransferase